jgi:hypothetical protein
VTAKQALRSSPPQANCGVTEDSIDDNDRAQASSPMPGQLRRRWINDRRSQLV